MVKTKLMFALHGAVSVVMLMAGATLMAQTGPSATQYTRSLWKVRDGLPEGTVQALAETPDGYLWIGTTGGLTRFDGTSFVLNGSTNLPLPSVSSVFCMLSAKDGSLWIGSEGSGLLHLKSNSFTSYSTAQGLTDGFVRSILEDSLGVVWIGTDNGLFQVDGARVKRVDVGDASSPLAVHSIAEDRAGSIWVGGSRLLSIHQGQVKTYPLPGTYSSNRVKTILQTADGTVWVGTVGGLQRLVNGRFVLMSGIQGTVRALHQTSDGMLWIGTIGNGLWHYKDGKLSQVNGLLPGSTVLQVFEDDSHQVWIGLQDGLVRLSRTPVQVVPLPGSPDADFGTISGNGDKDLWVVASGVDRIHEGVARPYRFPELPPNVMVRNVFRAHQGDLWIGTDGSGAFRISGKGVVHYAAPGELTNNFIRVFLETREGDIWIGTDEGVSRISGPHVQRYGKQDGLVYFSIRSLLQDRAGDIWIGTDQGLSHWRQGKFVHDAVTEALQHEKIWSIYEDDVGSLWFGTRGDGLYRDRDGDVARITTAQGLVSNSIYQILEDPQKRVWLSGPNTISSLRLDELTSSLDGAKGPLSVSVYAMPYGAEDAQMYGGRQPAGYLDQSGGVWFPSNKGAVHVRIADRAMAKPPKIAMESIAVDGRELPLAARMKLPSRMSRLRFAFEPLSLLSQSGVRYRYRLENFDKDWIFAGSDRSASYTNLPAGTYHFQVEAYDVGDPGMVSEASVELDKAPLFWQTAWFVTLCVVTGSLLAWAIYSLRMHQIKLRFRAVLDERGRLAREMHDTVIQGCTSISALLEAIASKRMGGVQQGDELLEYARTQVRSTINEARSAVWNLRHEQEATLDLEESLQAISAQTRKESAVAVECVANAPVRVPGSIARELLMVVREAVYNAVLHGKPNRVTIHVTYEPRRLRLTVVDDGSGFVTSELPADGHYGITGMRERVERAGGKMTLTSAPGMGTTVEVSLPRSILGAEMAVKAVKQPEAS